MAHFQVSLPEKLIDFQVAIPGNQLISGVRDPEVKFCEKLHALIYDLNFKKNWGHLRIIFLTSGYRDPEVKNIFVNISAKTKIFSKIF